MSRKKGNAKPRPYKWLGHITVHFNDREVGECQKWLEGLGRSSSDIIDTLVQAETPIKISYNTSFDAYHASLQPKSQTSHYRGYTLGFSHTNLERLLAIVLYIHEVLLEAGSIDIPNTGEKASW